MKVLKRIVSVVLAILMFVSLVATIGLGSLNKTLKNPETLAYNVIDDEYVNHLYDEIYSSLDHSLSLVLIKPADFSDVLTKDVIREECVAGLTVTMNKAYGVKVDDYKFDNTALYNRVAEKLSQYAKEYEIDYSEDAVKTVYTLITDKVTGHVIVLADNYTAKIAPIMAKVQKALSLWTVPLIVYIVCLIGVILLDMKKLKYAFYTATLPSYFASFLMLCISVVLLNKDYLSKTVLSDGTLQHTLEGIYNLTLGDMKQIALMLTILFLVCAIATITVIALKISRRRHHHHHHHE